MTGLLNDYIQDAIDTYIWKNNESIWPNYDTNCIISHSRNDSLTLTSDNERKSSSRSSNTKRMNESPHNCSNPNNNNSNNNNIINNRRYDDPQRCNELTEFLNGMIQRLHKKRVMKGRSYNLDEMSRVEIAMEKSQMQEELLNYENKYGRPTTKLDRDIMKNIYDRYRAVKQRLKALPPDVTALLVNVTPKTRSLKEKSDDDGTKLMDPTDQTSKRSTRPYHNEYSYPKNSEYREKHENMKNELNSSNLEHNHSSNHSSKKNYR
ncbi:hypothetical protein SNEBB_001989 [Seison nebaliae]|nr:hypothetical protein SNEBB_001989 [Seison nebaliae]